MRDPSDGPQELRLRLLRAGGPAELSSVLPLLEAMGLVVAEELNYRIRPKGAAAPIALHVFRMRTKRPQPLDLAVVREAFEDAMRAVWAGEAESDGLNQLTLAAGLPWRAVAGLRACVRYLRQAGIAFSQAYMEDALARNADVAALVVKLFAVKFDPAWGKSVEERRSAAAAVSRKIDAALADVKSLDDDRILRRVRNVAPRPASGRTCSGATRTAATARRSPSSSTPAASRACPRPCRSPRSSSIPRASRACICASARSRAAAYAGPTGARTSGPRSWAS